MFNINNPHRSRNLFGCGCGSLAVLAGCLLLVVCLVWWNPLGIHLTVGQPTPAPIAAAAQTPVAPAAGFDPSKVEEPIQIKDMTDSIRFPKVFKGDLNGIPVCGAIEVGATYPEGFKETEHFPKDPMADGDYLQADKSNTYGMYQYCAGTTPAKHLLKGDKWTFVLILKTGVLTVKEFGPDLVIPQ